MKKILLTLLLVCIVICSNALPGYTYNRSIIIDNTGNTHALNDQVTLYFDANNFSFDNAMTNGEDVRFTKKDSTTILTHWFKCYSQCARTATIMVLVNGISAASIDTIMIWYGKSGSTSTSSFANTMRRFSTSEDSAKYVVRFNDGSGSIAVNSGSSGGTMSLYGGYTWNTADTYGESTGSLTFNGTSGYAEKTGLLDDWGNEGHIKIRFKYNGSASNFSIFSKHNRLIGTGADLGDYIDCLIVGGTKKLQLNFYKGTVKMALNGGTILEAGKFYELSFTWNQQTLFLYLNGEMEANYHSLTTGVMPPAGSATPFRIACLTNTTTGAASLFSAIQVNDFVYQSIQPYQSKLQSYHDNRTYFQKDEPSKWCVSRTPEFGGASTAAITESSLIWDGTQFVLYYGRVLSGSSQSVFRRTVAAIGVNTTNSWSSETRVISTYARTHSMHKFGSTYYCYYRNSSQAGPVMVATSADGITFSAASTVLPQPSAGFGSLGFFNTGVVYDASDNLYKMVVDDVDAVLFYTAGVAVSSSPSGTFTLQCLNPKYSMAFDGTWGGASVNRIGSKTHCWYLGKQVPGGILPSEIYRSHTTNFQDWTHAYEDAVIIRERQFEFDQASDCYVMEANGNCYMTYLQGTNTGGFKGYLNIAKFNGMLSQLVTDLSYTVGSEFTN